MTDKLKAIILEHIKKYPQAELQDILKLLYQNEFGPKHLADNEIEAITGSTITSKAMANGCNAALEYFKTVLQTKGGAQ